MGLSLNGGRIEIEKIKIKQNKEKNQPTTLNNGYLGSRNDEERSEMRYVMRIADNRESSRF